MKKKLILPFPCEKEGGKDFLEDVPIAVSLVAPLLSAISSLLEGCSFLPDFLRCPFWGRLGLITSWTSRLSNINLQFLQLHNLYLQEFLWPFNCTPYIPWFRQRVQVGGLRAETDVMFEWDNDLKGKCASFIVKWNRLETVLNSISFIWLTVNNVADFAPFKILESTKARSN